MLSDRCLSCPVLSVCLRVTFVHCGQTVGRIKMKLGRPRPWPHCVRWGPSSPSPKGHSPTQFSAYICCGHRPNGCMDQHATWYGARPQLRRLCVRWRPRSTLPKKGAEPPRQFSPVSIVAKRLHASRCHVVWR